MLRLWRNHLKKCPHRGKGRAYIKCNCPIWADGELDGKRYRYSLDTRDWARAGRKLAELEDPRAPRLKPITQAAEAFGQHILSLEPSTQRKYKNVLRHFRDFCEGAGVRDVVDVRIDSLDAYRAGRALARTTTQKELETLRNQSRQTSTSLESSLKAQSAAPAGAAATADYWPREAWAFAGYASPDAALQSSFWASNQGDVKTFLGGIEGEILQKVQKDSEGKSEDELSAKAIAEVASLKSVRILNREVRAEDTVVLTAEFEEGNSTHTTKLLMKKYGNDWKLSGHL